MNNCLQDLVHIGQHIQTPFCKSNVMICSRSRGRERKREKERGKRRGGRGRQGRTHLRGVLAARHSDEFRTLVFRDHLVRDLAPALRDIDLSVAACEVGPVKGGVGSMETRDEASSPGVHVHVSCRYTRAADRHASGKRLNCIQHNATDRARPMRWEPQCRCRAPPTRPTRDVRERPGAHVHVSTRPIVALALFLLLAHSAGEPVAIR